MFLLGFLTCRESRSFIPSAQFDRMYLRERAHRFVVTPVVGAALRPR